MIEVGTQDRSFLKENGEPDISPNNCWAYLSTRFPTLLDIPIRKSDKTVLQTLNIFLGLLEMTRLNWSLYLLGWAAWTVDSLDFFCVSASAPEIAATLGTDITDITWGVTLVLMLRSVGALIFGISSDIYGRKWPFIICCLLFVVLEIGTGFVQTYKQFLGVRALFGIAMGGMYGNAAATALEEQPEGAKSVLSGFFLPGYNFGYLLAIVFYRAFQFTYKPGEGWRALFWFSAGLPVLLIAWRLCLPESANYLRLKEKRKMSSVAGVGKLKKVRTSLAELMRTEWLMFIYLVILMSGFNFMSHGSQDLYPTFLVKQLGVGPDRKTVIMVVVNLGAMCGGIFFGQLTEFLGRRLTIIITCIWSGAFIYPSFISKDLNVITGCYFFLCFGTMGAWGVAPLHLLELVNPENRVLLSGFVYQLGNLASSASSTIEAQVGTRFPLHDSGLQDAYDYGKVMAIFCGAVYAYMIVAVFFGPERFHRDLTIHRTISKEEIMDCESRLDKDEKPVVVYQE